MTNFSSVIQELQHERDRLDAAIQALSSLNGNNRSSATRRGRTMTAASRARIAAAQRARWAKLRAAATNKGQVSRPKRRISAAGLARIKAAQRARWAKIKGSKK